MSERRKNTKVRKVQANIIEQHNTPEEIADVSARFLQIVGQIENPRTRPCDYPLDEILLIAIIAVMCGSESHQDFVTFGEAQIEWFRQYVPLENGVSAHDTFRRVLMLLKPESLNDAYHELLQGLKIDEQGNHSDRHIAIDGKKSNGCYYVKGQSLLHTVSAWQ